MHVALLYLVGVGACAHSLLPSSALLVTLLSGQAAAIFPYMNRRSTTLAYSDGFRSECMAMRLRSINSRSVSHMRMDSLCLLSSSMRPPHRSQKKPTLCTNTGQAKGDTAQRQGHTTNKHEGIGHCGLTCYSFSSCLCTFCVGLCQFWHKNGRVLHLDCGGYSTPVPVAYPLRTPAAHVEFLGQFYWATIGVYQLAVTV